MKSNLKKPVILLHGAVVDAKGWQKVIPLLEKEGLAVTAA